MTRRTAILDMDNPDFVPKLVKALGVEPGDTDDDKRFGVLAYGVKIRHHLRQVVNVKG